MACVIFSIHFSLQTFTLYSTTIRSVDKVKLLLLTAVFCTLLFRLYFTDFSCLGPRIILIPRQEWLLLILQY